MDQDMKGISNKLYLLSLLSMFVKLEWQKEHGCKMGGNDLFLLNTNRLSLLEDWSDLLFHITSHCLQMQNECDPLFCWGRSFVLQETVPLFWHHPKFIVSWLIASELLHYSRILILFWVLFNTIPLDVCYLMLNLEIYHT